jgi:hypothetical protein
MAARQSEHDEARFLFRVMLRPHDLAVASADRYSNDVPVSFSDTSQSLAAVAASRARGMISAGAGAPRSSPSPAGP